MAGGTPSCKSGLTSDVWYIAEVPASGNLSIETHNVADTYFDSVLTVYSGTPSNLTEVACDDDGGMRNLSKVILTGQTAGATLYVRVVGYDGDRTPFEICAWDGTLSTASISSEAIRVYPNPTTAMLYIESPMDVHGLSVISLTGAVVLKESILYTASPILDVSSLTAGFYLIHIEHAKGSDYFKFIME